MTIYLKFPDMQTAMDAMTGAEYSLSEWCDHFDGNGWGTILPDPNSTDILANIYDCGTCPEALAQYEITTPQNPLNVVAA